MEANKILCSTGCLIGRPNGRNYHLIKPYSSGLSCDGLEFMMYEDWYSEVAELLDNLLGLNAYIPVMHCQKSVGELLSMGDAENWSEAFSRFEINCRIAQTIGAKKLVMHLWDGITSDRHFEHNLKAYGELLPIAREYDLELLIENVVCAEKNPMYRWQQLADRYPEVLFIFDTKMAEFHGQLELLYTEEFSWLWKEHRIRHLHVNDYGGGYMDWDKLKTLPIGAGHIDFRQFFDFIHKIGYRGTFTVEATAFRQDGTVDQEMLNQCFEKIRNYFLLNGQY